MSKTRRQMPGFHHFRSRLAHDDGALQHVAQFANVPWPVVLLEHLHDFFANGSDFALMLAAHVGKQVLYELWQILFVLAQWRKINVENVEAVKQVIAYFAASDSRLRQLVGGR